MARVDGLADDCDERPAAASALSLLSTDCSVLDLMSDLDVPEGAGAIASAIK